MSVIDKVVVDMLVEQIRNIEGLLKSDVISYYGAIDERIENVFFNTIESLAESNCQTLTIILTTNGGSAETVERMVKVIRHHYDTVNFIIPDCAYSAGTIFCMSGDNIFMDYKSVLGPIDPQVKNRDGRWVPALGYLDKINELLGKALDNTISHPEFLLLKEFDLAELRAYEQARDLAVSLLTTWLTRYKFKTWNVSQETKEIRAKEIASELGNNSRWLSHGRPIDMAQLRELRLEINDYGENLELRSAIRNYYSLFADYIFKYQISFLIQTREVFIA